LRIHSVVLLETCVIKSPVYAALIGPPKQTVDGGGAVEVVWVTILQLTYFSIVGFIT
jgi:hypothetical protein